jgi:hypothetical protein
MSSSERFAGCGGRLRRAASTAEKTVGDSKSSDGTKSARLSYAAETPSFADASQPTLPKEATAAPRQQRTNAVEKRRPKERRSFVKNALAIVFIRFVEGSKSPRTARKTPSRT